MKPPRRSLLLVLDPPRDLAAHRRRLASAGYTLEACGYEAIDSDRERDRPAVGLVRPTEGDGLARAMAAGVDAAVVLTDDPADLLEELELLDL